ncbi:hypothetical protein NQZ68_038971 [Dissostichus eleginoides]|nr:hypothetical protein NQZ68_038971 [Dissostichus eleginoides]
MREVDAELQLRCGDSILNDDPGYGEVSPSFQGLALRTRPSPRIGWHQPDAVHEIHELSPQLWCSYVHQTLSCPKEKHLMDRSVPHS